MLTTVEHEDHQLRIRYDLTAPSPRTQVCFGHLVLFHEHYVADANEHTEPLDFLAQLAASLGVTPPDASKGDGLERWVHAIQESAILLPVFVYEEGAVSFATTLYPDACSGAQVGYTYVSFVDIRKRYGRVTISTRKQATQRLQDELKRFESFVTGQVYCFTIERRLCCPCCAHVVRVDTLRQCGGFYGPDLRQNGLLACIPEPYRQWIEEKGV